MDSINLPHLGYDRIEYRRSVTLLGWLFVAVTVSSFLWWEVSVAYANTLQDVLGIGTFAFHDLQVSWMYGVMSLGCTAAGIYAYRTNSVLGSVLFGIVAFGGYLVGAGAAGIVHGGGPIENLIRYGAIFGGLGFVGGATLARVTGGQDMDEPSSISQTQVLLVLSAGFVLGFLALRPLIGVLVQTTG